MPYIYSDPSRETDRYAIPDVQVFQLTAEEVAEQCDQDVIQEYLRRPEFRLASMNARVRARMIDAMITEEGITGGWFYWFCFPGCMPEGDGTPSGPFKTHDAAVAAARAEVGE